MTVIVGRRGILGDIHGEVARLDALLADLRNIAGGRLPSDAELRDAPIIDLWTGAERRHPCLAGRVHGHPHLRGPVSVTSDLWAFAPDHGWARTLSRFYRLGRPLGAEDAS